MIMKLKEDTFCWTDDHHDSPWQIQILMILMVLVPVIKFSLTLSDLTLMQWIESNLKFLLYLNCEKRCQELPTLPRLSICLRVREKLLYFYLFVLPMIVNDLLFRDYDNRYTGNPTLATSHFTISIREDCVPCHWTLFPAWNIMIFHNQAQFQLAYSRLYDYMIVEVVKPIVVVDVHYSSACYYSHT